MTLVINILFVLVIISYSAYVLTRYIKKSKKGQCSACDMNEGCQTNHLPKHLQN
ncbi:FeoB-associated Cys-rich membrane protein [Staphylococcus chromogenes]|uniref:FeoB-associated Cys-rich membrane protein n=1 Tax=Staphylococcus chromogenes TaxID=46126 RepID=UPI000D1AEA2C|nr:FeoB-associated Cys-rich membrane protein [Staphylococcus chromogenes]PTG07757.1 FeoB-associated Cys-rich membrane protein [Staphylococcus chromogenes]PTG14335.1 FeoB-associated Cys-rich membrane protein [Staphylococcus chromogenes]